MQLKHPKNFSERRKSQSNFWSSFKNSTICLLITRLVATTKISRAFLENYWELSSGMISLVISPNSFPALKCASLDPNKLSGENFLKLELYEVKKFTLNISPAFYNGWRKDILRKLCGFQVLSISFIYIRWIWWEMLWKIQNYWKRKLTWMIFFNTESHNKYGILLVFLQSQFWSCNLFMQINWSTAKKSTDSAFFGKSTCSWGNLLTKCDR